MLLILFAGVVTGKDTSVDVKSSWFDCAMDPQYAIFLCSHIVLWTAVIWFLVTCMTKPSMRNRAYPAMAIFLASIHLFIVIPFVFAPCNDYVWWVSRHFPPGVDMFVDSLAWVTFFGWLHLYISGIWSALRHNRSFTLPVLSGIAIITTFFSGMHCYFRFPETLCFVLPPVAVLTCAIVEVVGIHRISVMATDKDPGNEPSPVGALTSNTDDRPKRPED